jgi:hypothetical protein
MDEGSMDSISVPPLNKYHQQWNDNIIANVNVAILDVFELIDELLLDTLMDHDVVSGLMSETNTNDWRVGNVEVLTLEQAPMGIRVHISWEVSGKQDEDQMYCGTMAFGTADVILETGKSPILENVDGDLERLGDLEHFSELGYGDDDLV